MKSPTNRRQRLRANVSRTGLTCVLWLLWTSTPAATVALEAATQAMSAASAGTAGVNVDATESWSRGEQELDRLLGEAAAAEIELARSPVPGASTDRWLRAGEADRAEVQRWAREAGETARDRQTLNWWLDQQLRRPASAARDSSPMLESDDTRSHRRWLLVVTMFAAAVLCGLIMLLERRPARQRLKTNRQGHRANPKAPPPNQPQVQPTDPTPPTPGLEGHRPHRRRRHRALSASG